MKYLIVIILFVSQFFFGMVYCQKLTKDATSVKIVETTKATEVFKPDHFSKIANGRKDVSSRIQITLNYLVDKGLLFKFNLKAYDNNEKLIAGCFDKEFYTLTVSPETTSALFDYSLNSQIKDNKLNIKKIVVVPLSKVDVNATVVFDVEYGQSVYFSNSPDFKLPSPTNLTAVTDSKNVKFEWEYQYPFSKYEIQLLRLYNIGLFDKDDESIKTTLDWSKAVTAEVDIENVVDAGYDVISKHEYRFSVNQGTGYYAWRIRAIGSFYEKGIANSLNWGEWSVDDENKIVTLKKNSLIDNYFYFKDINEKINYTNSKVFSEDNSVKEVTTFADGLSNVQQTRTYYPSTNTTIGVQNVNDYSGRSTIQSLPIPTKDQGQKYAPLLISNKKSYSASNFDYEGKNADVIDGDVVSYYNGNKDEKVADAEGVPFVQKTFYDDPLNRLKQEGGPGATSKIDNVTTESNKNRNTKYYYGIASESEIVRLFGKESPLPNTVNKVAKVDPNGVATITYTGADNKILATCIAFSEKETNLVKLDGNYESTTKITHTLNDNTKEDWGFLSSKRIIILADATPIFIDYVVDNPKLNFDCANVKIDCHYTVEVAIFKIDKKENIKELIKEKVVEINKDQQGFSFTETLNAGTYVIEKKLIFGEPSIKKDDAEKSVYAKTKPIPDLVKALLNAVTCKIQIPDFQDDLRLIYNCFNNQNLDNLDKFINNPELNSIRESLEKFKSSYVEETNKNGYTFRLFYKDKIKGIFVSYNPADNPKQNADLVVFNTPCCQVNVPVKWIRKFDKDEIPYIDSRVPGKLATPKDVIDVEENENDFYEYLPDFEGYAMAYFKDCKKLNNTGEGSFRDYMKGWDTPGMFNYMVYHMLTDKLEGYVKNPIVEDQKKKGLVLAKSVDETIEKDCKGNVIDKRWKNGVYDTKQLFDCWVKQLEILGNFSGCNDYVLDTDLELKNKVDVASEFDSQKDGNKEIFNAIFEKVWSAKPWWGKIWPSKKRQRRNMIAELRAVGADPEENNITNSVDVKASIYDRNIVQGFLDCTGYNFVKIITPYDANPVPEDRSAVFTYTETKTEPPFMYKLNSFPSVNEYFDSESPFIKVGNVVVGNPYATIDFPYIPIKNKIVKTGSIFNPMIKTITTTLLPRIKNPIYAFKYFEYGEEGMDNTQIFESKYCYTDPNDCYSVRNVDSFYEQDLRGGLKKIPCCGQPGDDLCYKDYKYPNLDALYTNDSRFTPAGEPKARYIVNDFDGKGKQKCPYDHYSWSSGQRYTFYKTLNSASTLFQELPDTEDDIKKCKDLTITTKWYQQLENGSSLLASEEDKDKPGFDITHPYTYVTPKGVSRENISFMEMMLMDKEKECLGECEKRREQFRTKIREALDRNCYEIDKCRGEGDIWDNIISSEEIDIMVDTLVSKCKSQCKVNTFSCLPINTRDSNEPKAKPGPSRSTLQVNYGVGGMPLDDASSSVYNYNDEMYKKADQPIEGYWDYNLTSKNEAEFSWYQYTALEQVNKWDFELNFPSKCSKIDLFATRAAEVSNALRTDQDISDFSNGDYITFENVDFGDNGVDGIEIEYIRKPIDDKVNDLPFFLNIYLDNGIKLGEILVGKAETTIIGEIKMGSKYTSLHTVKIEGVGDVNLKMKIVRIGLKTSSGGKLNSREFPATEGRSNYVPKDKFEILKNTIPDVNEPFNSETIISPSKSIKVEVDNK